MLTGYGGEADAIKFNDEMALREDRMGGVQGRGGVRLSGGGGGGLQGPQQHYTSEQQGGLSPDQPQQQPQTQGIVPGMSQQDQLKQQRAAEGLPDLAKAVYFKQASPQTFQEFNSKGNVRMDAAKYDDEKHQFTFTQGGQTVTLPEEQSLQLLREAGINILDSAGRNKELAQAGLEQAEMEAKLAVSKRQTNGQNYLAKSVFFRDVANPDIPLDATHKQDPLITEALQGTIFRDQSGNTMIRHNNGQITPISRQQLLDLADTAERNGNQLLYGNAVIRSDTQKGIAASKGKKDTSLADWKKQVDTYRGIMNTYASDTSNPTYIDAQDKVRELMDNQPEVSKAKGQEGAKTGGLSMPQSSVAATMTGDQLRAIRRQNQGPATDNKPVEEQPQAIAPQVASPQDQGTAGTGMIRTAQGNIVANQGQISGGVQPAGLTQKTNPEHDQYNFLDGVIKSGQNPKTGQPLTAVEIKLARAKMAELWKNIAPAQGK